MHMHDVSQRAWYAEKRGGERGRVLQSEVRQEILAANPTSVECAVSAWLWQEQGGEEKPLVGRSCTVLYSTALQQVPPDKGGGGGIDVHS